MKSPDRSAGRKAALAGEYQEEPRCSSSYATALLQHQLIGAIWRTNAFNSEKKNPLVFNHGLNLMLLFDLRGSQEMAREPMAPDINTSWLGPRAIAIIFTGDFIFHVRFIFRPGCARLSCAPGHVLISSDINGSADMKEDSLR